MLDLPRPGLAVLAARSVSDSLGNGSLPHPRRRLPSVGPQCGIRHQSRRKRVENTAIKVSRDAKPQIPVHDKTRAR